ncbi:MAG: hypothetical protein ACJ71U_14135 [Terriglobales bacterium]
MSDFPAYEKSNKTSSDLCSIAARYENTAPKMSAWIVGFYQKKTLKRTEFEPLSFANASGNFQQLSYQDHAETGSNRCQSSDSRCCAVAQDYGLKVALGSEDSTAQSGFCCEALKKSKSWVASITFCQHYRARAMDSAPAPSSACKQWIRALKFHGHDDLGLSTITLTSTCQPKEKIFSP